MTPSLLSVESIDTYYAEREILLFGVSLLVLDNLSALSI